MMKRWQKVLHKLEFILINLYHYDEKTSVYNEINY